MILRILYPFVKYSEEVRFRNRVIMSENPDFHLKYFRKIRIKVIFKVLTVLNLRAYSDKILTIE